MLSVFHTKFDMSNTFKALAKTAQQILETRSTNAKIATCARYFKSLKTDKDLNRAAQFLGEGAFSSISGKRAVVGSRTYSTCAAEFCGIDYEKVFKPSKTALGSSSEAIGKLMRNINTARSKRYRQISHLLRWRPFMKVFQTSHPAPINNKFCVMPGNR